MSLVSQSLDYKSVDVSYPTYQLSKVTSQLPLSDISVSGGNESIFELPPKVMNLGKSILSFTATVPKTGDLSSFFHADGLSFIRQIQLYTRQGLFLADINACNYYTKAVNRRSNKISDVQSYDVAVGGDTATTDNSGYFTGIQCSNIAVAAGNAGGRPDNTAARTNFLEPAYTIIGVKATEGPIISVQVPLSRIVDSIVGMDKDQFFGESVYLRIVWSPSVDIGFTATEANNPKTGDALLATPITIDSLLFYGAIEQNQVIVQSLVDRFKSGTLSYNIPYIHMNTVSLAAGTNNISTRYSAPFGHRLQRVIWCPFLNDGAASGTYGKYDNSNMIVGGNASKVSSFYIYYG